MHETGTARYLGTLPWLNISWHSETMRLVIEHEADVNARDESNEAPPAFSSLSGECRICATLRLARADAHVQDQRYLARLPPVQFDERSEIVQVLIRHEADVNASDETHSTLLHLASSKGCVESVKLLIQHGADVNAKNGEQSTPAHLAVSTLVTTHSNLNGDLVCLLLSHGADAGSKDARGQTPLQIASSRGLSRIAGLLLSVI
jgi:ankyrin repeat protein